MVQDVSAPISIVVVAVAVVPSPDNPAKTRMLFARLAAACESVGAVQVDPANAGASIAFEPGNDPAPAIAELAGYFADFEQQCAPARLRALIHLGIGFRALEASGKTGFRGSGVRGAENLLKRLAPPAGLYASADFARLAPTLPTVGGLNVSATPETEFGGLHRVEVPAGMRRAAPRELRSDDPALVIWLKARLAKDLGPFAGALVDNAIDSTRTARELAAAVGHEIVSPRHRQRFDNDVFTYLESRIADDSGG